MPLKVSICMITYNHENFIVQTIEGVMMQQTDFEYELVIGEDLSTDNTRNIISAYQEKHPDKIRLLLPDKNLGMMPNFIQTLQACTGEYIALCEGDDYWTDPLKLQKQVNFLDANPAFSICFHRVQIAFQNHPEKNYLSNLHQADVTSIVNLARNSFIHTTSCMYRNYRFEIPEWFYQSPVGDYPLHLINASYGKIKFLKDVMATYRVHDGGVWSDIPKTQQLIQWNKALSLMIQNFEGEVKVALLKQRKNNLKELNKTFKTLKKRNPEPMLYHRAFISYIFSKVMLYAVMFFKKLLN